MIKAICESLSAKAFENRLDHPGRGRYMLPGFSLDSMYMPRSVHIVARVRVLAATSLLLFSAPALPQDWGISVQNSYLPSIEFNRVNAQAMEAARRTHSNDESETSSQMTDPAVTSFSFASSPARTQDNLARFVDSVRARNPAEARNLEALFASQPNIVESVRRIMQQYGLEPDNVADAYALWWMSAWLAVNQRHDTPDAQTVVSVQAQARAAFASTSDVTGTNDAQRQRYAEALMVQSLLLSTALEHSQGDAAAMAKLAQAAGQGAKASGLDLTAMTLTNGGFALRD